MLFFFPFSLSTDMLNGTGLELIHIYTARQLKPTWSYRYNVEIWHIFGAMLIISSSLFSLLLLSSQLSVSLFGLSFSSYFCRLVTMNKTRLTTFGYLLWRAENWAMNWFISLLAKLVWSTSQYRPLELMQSPIISCDAFEEKEMLRVLKCAKV